MKPTDSAGRKDLQSSLQRVVICSLQLLVSAGSASTLQLWPQSSQGSPRPTLSKKEYLVTPAEWKEETGTDVTPFMLTF